MNDISQRFDYDKLNNAPEFMTPADLIEILPIGRDKVYQIVKQSSFPAVKIGRTYVIRKDDFNKWWKSHLGKEFVI